MDDWQARVDAFWDEFTDDDPDGQLGAMMLLVNERPADDAVATFELAGVHDSLGHEQEAIPLYRRALELGLDPFRAGRASIQLASSLRNVGRSDEAVAILTAMRPVAELGHARDAFLALALHSAGRPTEALSVALIALSDTLPRYQRSARAYAEELE